MPNPYHVRLAISQYGDRFRAELFTEDLGDTDGELLPANWRESFDIWMRYLQEGGRIPAGGDENIGGQLFDWIFAGKANSVKWAEILARVERDRTRPLRLLIDSSTLDRDAGDDADRIHNLPYGLLFDRGSGYFLFRQAANRPEIQYVRMVRRCPPRLLKLESPLWPLRALIAVAEPAGLEFDGAKGLHRLAAGLGALSETFAVSLCTPDGVQPLPIVLNGSPESWPTNTVQRLCYTTKRQLRAALADSRFDILHLMAHGRGNGLLLSDEDGRACDTTASELTEWCNPTCTCEPKCPGPCRMNPRAQMAFLQVCKASRTGGQGAFGGLAQRLLSPDGGDLAAVIASPYPLEEQWSTRAAVIFYEKTAKGEQADRAIQTMHSELGMANGAWAFLEIWVRPGSLGDAGTRGTFQFVSPYRGLAQFKERDADIFFGRNAEVNELKQILLDEVILAVVGDSGSGKSSLLHAGLAHQVRQHGLAGYDGWRIISLRPGTEPAKNLLAAVLLDKVGTAEDIHFIRPEKSYETLIHELQHECIKGGRLLLLFDQFEEMQTLCTDGTQRDAVARVLVEMAKSFPNNYRLVLGIRSEYLNAIASLQPFEHFIRRPWLLRAPGPTDLRKIIVSPAQRYGYTFEGSRKGHQDNRSLLDRILQDPLFNLASAEPDAAASILAGQAAPLPLVEFGLEQLWLMAVKEESREFQHMHYDIMRGLSGSVARYASDVYSSLSLDKNLGPEAQEIARKIFMGVVTSRGLRRPRIRVELEAETGNSDLAHKVIDRLVGDRLLAVRSDPQNFSNAMVDLSHEVLVKSWDQLKGWLDDNRITLRIREEIAGATRNWVDGIAEGRVERELLIHRGSRLADARGLLTNPSLRISEIERNYINACLKQEDEERKAEEEQKSRELTAALRWPTNRKRVRRPNGNERMRPRLRLDGRGSSSAAF